MWHSVDSVDIIRSLGELMSFLMVSGVQWSLRALYYRNSDPTKLTVAR